MLDYLNLGYSQLTSAIALVGGFCGAATFFFLNQFKKEDIDWGTRILNLLGSLFFITSFLIIFYIFVTNGTNFIEYSQTLPKESQISLNFSCLDELNCSARIPTKLTISCQNPQLPEEKSCLISNMTIIEKPCPNCTCPMLTIPKFKSRT